MSVPSAPFSNSIVPQTWSGVRTWIFSPSRPLVVIVRSGMAMVAAPVIRRVGLGHREVQDEVHVRVSQQLLGSEDLRDAELFGPRAGALRVQVRARGDLQDGQAARVAQVVGADGSAADDSDAELVSIHLT